MLYSGSGFHFLKKYAFLFQFQGSIAYVRFRLWQFYFDLAIFNN